MPHLLELPIDSVARTVQQGRGATAPAARRNAPPQRAAANPAQPAAGAPVKPLSPPDNLVRHQRRMLSYLLRERALLAHVRSLVAPEELTDPQVRQIFEKLLRLTDDEFTALADEELLWMFPDLAPQLQAFLLDEPVMLLDILDYRRSLLNEVAEIKKALNKRLRDHLRKVTGTPDEAAALLRAKELSEQIAQLKAAAPPTPSSSGEV